MSENNNKNLLDLRDADNIYFIYDHKDCDEEELGIYSELVVKYTGIDPLHFETDEKRILSKAKNFGILIIDDIDDIQIGVLAKLLGCIRPGSKNISLITVNNIERFNQIYKDTFGSKVPMIPVVQKNEFGVYLSNHFVVDNINIAIVTDNIDAFYNLIKNSFSDLGNEDIDPSDDIEDFTDKCEDIKGHRHNIPLCHPFIPRLIQQWVYCVWYKKPIKHDKPHRPKDNDDNVDVDTTTDNTGAYVRDSISIKVNNNTYVTFWLIVPQADVDLCLLCNLMDYVYMDLASSYPVNAMYPKADDMLQWKKIIPFLFSYDNCNQMYNKMSPSIGQWTNIGRNISTFMRFTIDSVYDSYIISANKDMIDAMNDDDQKFMQSYIRHGCIVPHRIDMKTRGIVYLHRIVKPDDIMTLDEEDCIVL